MREYQQGNPIWIVDIRNVRKVNYFKIVRIWSAVGGAFSMASRSENLDYPR
jgi:hypothetical protein